MPGSVDRLGPGVVLAGIASVAAGLFLNSVSLYWEITHLFGLGTGSAYRFYEQLEAISYFLLGVGVLLVGVGWYLHQGGVFSAKAGAPGSRRGRKMLGLLLVLGGVTLAAGWWVFEGAVEEEAIAGVSLHLPIWFPSLTGVFLGVGLAAWGVGWFLYRASWGADGPPV